MNQAGTQGSLEVLARRHWPNALFVLCALVVFCWVSFEAIWVRSVTFEGGSDYWEHSATLHALMQKPWHPSNPHLVSLAPSSRFGPQFLLIALVARGLHLNVLGAMSLSAVANTLLFVLGIRVFFSTYFRHPLAPLYGLLVMLTGWWHGFHYSNVYQLHVLFTVASYPSTTALGLSLLGFALAVRLLRAELARPKVALAVLLLWTAAVFIIHPLTAMLTLSGTGLLAICVPKAGLRVRLELIATLVAGLIFARFWPYFSPWEVVRGGHGAAAGWAGDSLNQMADLHVKRTLHEFYHADGLIAALGMALLALLALPYFLIRRERWFVGFGALSMLLPFVVNVFVDLPLGHRFVLLAIVYLHIGVVWLLLKLTPSYEHAWPLFDRPWSKVAAACGIAALLVVFAVHSALLARDTLRNPKFYSRPESPVVSNMKAFADAAGQNAVVLASPLLSWPLPTFGPKVLVLYHYDPLVSDQTEREFYVARFLGRSTDEQRAQILAHYGVTHVLLSRESSSGLLRFLDQHSTVRRVGTGYRLYTLDPSAKTL